MSDVAQQSPISTIGHNQPPPYDVVAKLGFDKRADELVEGADRLFRSVGARMLTDDEAKRANEFQQQILAELSVIEDQRVKDKKPHIDAGKKVDDAFNGIRDRLRIIVDQIIRPKLTAFLKEQERVAREQAEEARREAQRKIDEAAAAEAAVGRKGENIVDQIQRAETKSVEAVAAVEAVKKADAIADAPRIRGDYSGRSTGLATVWKHEVENWDVVLKRYASNAKLREAVDKLIGAEVRGGTREIEGVRIYPERVAR